MTHSDQEDKVSNTESATIERGAENPAAGLRWDAQAHGKLPPNPEEAWRIRQAVTELAVRRANAVARWRTLIELSKYPPWHPADVAVLFSNQQASAAEFGRSFSESDLKLVLSMLPHPYLIRTLATDSLSVHVPYREPTGTAGLAVSSVKLTQASESFRHDGLDEKWQPESPCEAFALLLHMELFTMLNAACGCVWGIDGPYDEAVARFAKEGDANINEQTGGGATWILANDEVAKPIIQDREPSILTPWLNGYGLVFGLLFYTTPLLVGRKAIIGRRDDNGIGLAFCPHVLKAEGFPDGVWAGSSAYVLPPAVQFNYGRLLIKS